MALVDPKTPLRSDLERMCGGNQRLVKAFEKLFRILPTIADDSNEDSAQISADTAMANAVLAIALINSVNDLAEMAASQPRHECTGNTQNEQFFPRYENVGQEVFIPASQALECSNYNLEVR